MYAAVHEHFAGTPRRIRMQVHARPDVHAAIRAGGGRVTMLYPLSSRGLDPQWAIDLDEDEVVIATERFIVEDVEGEPVGVAALIVKRAALPSPALDDSTRERMVQALVDLLLADGGTR